MSDPVVLELAPIRSGETVSYSVDFGNVMGSGVTISTTPNWTISVKSGTAGLAVSGSATSSGTKAVQKLTSGVDGSEYYVLASITTSDSQTLEQLCTLKCEDAES